MAGTGDEGKQNVLRFRLNGAEYTLRGDMPVERLETVVKLVERKVNAIRDLSPSYTSVRVATLAALQLAEDLLEAREENELILAEAKSASFQRPAAAKTSDGKR